METNKEDTYKQTLNTALKNFNQAYSEYQQECSNISVSKTLCDASTLKTTYNELMRVIEDTLKILNNGDGTSTTFGNGKIDGNNMEDEYNKLLCLRDSLDERLAEFKENGKYEYYIEMFDITLYTKIIWTLLVVCLVFYCILHFSKE